MNTTSKVFLKSDYHDCYDVWLEREGEVCFSRVAEDSWSVHRTQMFDLFKTLGIAHPPYRKVPLFRDADMLVVYTDPYSHQGEGKLLLPYHSANNSYADCFASLYISDLKGVSYRYIVVAGKGAWFKHWSTDNWRSNCGDGDLSPVTQDFSYLQDIEERCSPIKNPVYAIDFVAQVINGAQHLLAIDWNPAPKLAGTPAMSVLQDHFGGNIGIARAITDSVLLQANDGVLDNNKILL